MRPSLLSIHALWCDCCLGLGQHRAVLQDVFNLLPNLDLEITRSFAVKSNDMMLVIYVASLIRSVLALHNLINNKVRGKGLRTPS